MTSHSLIKKSKRRSPIKKSKRRSASKKSKRKSASKKSKRRSASKKSKRRSASKKSSGGSASYKWMDSSKFKKNSLGKYGYKSSISLPFRHAALEKAVKAYGSKSVWSKLNAVAILNKNRSPTTSNIFTMDKNWVKRKFIKSPQNWEFLDQKNECIIVLYSFF